MEAAQAIGLRDRIGRGLNGHCQTNLTGIGSIADDFHRRSVRPKTVGYNCLRSAVTPHRALQESQRSPAIPALRREDLKHLTFVIYLCVPKTLSALIS